MERILSAEVEIKVQDAAKNLDKLADKTSQAAASVDKNIDKLSNAGKNVGAGLDKGTKKATASVDKMQKDIASDAAKVEKDLAKIAVAASKTGDRLDAALPNAAGKSAQALTNLNRVIQDAPFGIIGIANNIDPLINSFQSLRKSTGSTIGAFGSLFSSLAGPTGILFAFSALSTGATLLVQKYGSLGEGLRVLAGITDGLNEGQKEFREELEKSRSAIEGQVVELEQLVKIAKGDIGSKKDQKEALKQLNDIIPDYIGYLTEQNIKTDEGTKILRAYTQALINAAEAELLAKRAGELRISLRKREKTITQDARKELDRNANANKAAAAGTAGLAGVVVASANAYDINARSAISNTKAVKGLINEYKELADIQSRLDILSLDKLKIEADDPDEGKIKKAVKKVQRVILEADFTVPLAAIEQPKINTKGIEIGVTPVLEPINTDFLNLFRNTIDNLRDDLQGSFKGFDFSNLIEKEYKDAIDGVKELANNGGMEDAFISADFLEKLQARFEQIKQATQTFINDIQNAVKDFELGGLSNLGAAIGTAMAEGTNALQAAGKSILSSIGSLLQKIGTAIITYAIALGKIKKFLQSGIFANPVFGITIGLAAIALGSALQASIPKFANGGIVTGPTLGLIGEAGQPEVILPLNKLNQFMSGGGSVVVLESVIKGSDLALIQSRTSGRQNRNF